MTDRLASPIDELHRRVGRNLLLFQRIEQSLKFLLPYVHPEGGAKGADALRDFSQSVTELTLGELIKQFKAAAQGTPEWWETGLAQLVAARNELAHEFFRNGRFNLLSPQGLQEALAYLDEQYHETQEWAEVIRVQSLLVLLILIDTEPGAAAQFGEYRERLIAQLPPSIEFVDQASPQNTVWASTRIVKLLRLAERNTEPVDGMTLLSRAGRYIIEQAPDLQVAEYGVRSLRRILEESQLFDVRGGSDGGAVLYRSIPAVASWPLDFDPLKLALTLVRPR